MCNASDEQLAGAPAAAAPAAAGEETVVPGSSAGVKQLLSAMDCDC